MGFEYPIQLSYLTAGGLIVLTQHAIRRSNFADRSSITTHTKEKHMYIAIAVAILAACVMAVIATDSDDDWEEKFSHDAW